MELKVNTYTITLLGVAGYSKDLAVLPGETGVFHWEVVPLGYSGFTIDVSFPPFEPIVPVKLWSLGTIGGGNVQPSSPTARNILGTVQNLSDVDGVFRLELMFDGGLIDWGLLHVSAGGFYEFQFVEYPFLSVGEHSFSVYNYDTGECLGKVYVTAATPMLGYVSSSITLHGGGSYDDLSTWYGIVWNHFTDSVRIDDAFVTFYAPDGGVLAIRNWNVGAACVLEYGEHAVIYMQGWDDEIQEALAGYPIDYRITVVFVQL